MINAVPQVATNDLMTFNTVVQHADFEHRDSCCHFEHNGSYYLSNGYQYGTAFNLRDLWASDDMVVWRKINGATPYQGYSPIVSFNGNLIACGDKVYSSSDGGETFSVILETPPFTVSTSTVYTSRLIVRNGRLLLFVQDRLWHSADGVSWASVTLPWPMRVNFAIWDFKGDVYIAAGNNDTPNMPPESGYPGKTSLNDVWKSSDPTLGPTSWTQLTSAAPWATRMWPGYCIHGDDLIIGYGYKNTATPDNYQDLWASKDGQTWRQISLSVAASKRHFSSMFSVGGFIWMTCGNQNPSQPGTVNDVLRLDPYKP